MAFQEQATEPISRKEKRYRAREAEILSVTRSLLAKYGLAALSMDRIAEAIDYSKAVIYQHFPCKEEIIVALATQSARARLKLHDTVLRFAGNSRERIIASGEATVVLPAEHFQCELITLTNALASKVSEARTKAFWEAVGNTILAASAIVEDAVAVGDLVLPAGLNPQAFTFSLWATVFGGVSLLTTAMGPIDESSPLEGRHMPASVQLVRRSGQAVLDGYGWRPLSSEWDYRPTMSRIYREAFTPEVIQDALSFGVD